MGNPNEKKPSSTEQTPLQGEKPADLSVSSSKPYETHHEAKDIQKDNAEFLNALEKIKIPEKQKIIDQAQKWADQGDLDLLRAAGLSFEQIQKDPLERHVKLAAAFLKRTPAKDKLTFKADFCGNDLAEYNADISDILPSNVLKVNIYDSEGKLAFENAKRTVRNSRPCYVVEANPPEPEKIAFLRTGFTVEITETQSYTALKDPSKGSPAKIKLAEEENYLKDNSRKTEIKNNVRQEAAKQGKQVITDQNFFDVILTGFIKALDESTKDGKFSFAVLGSKILSLIDQVGFKNDPRNTSFDQQQSKRPVQPALPEGAIPKAKEDLAPRPGEKPPVDVKIDNEKDRQLVSIAKGKVGSMDFRGRDVDGGNLACAKVASTILKEAGAIDKVILGVGGVESELTRKGWIKHSGPPHAGDVIIWGPTPKRIGGDGSIRVGHGHIGIMTSETYSVNNNSKQKMPIESKVDFHSPRGIHFLSPPHRYNQSLVA